MLRCESSLRRLDSLRVEIDHDVLFPAMDLEVLEVLVETLRWLARDGSPRVERVGEDGLFLLDHPHRLGVLLVRVQALVCRLVKLVVELEEIGVGNGNQLRLRQSRLFLEDRAWLESHASRVARYWPFTYGRVRRRRLLLLGGRLLGGSFGALPKGILDGLLFVSSIGRRVASAGQAPCLGVGLRDSVEVMRDFGGSFLPGRGVIEHLLHGSLHILNHGLLRGAVGSLLLKLDSNRLLTLNSWPSTASDALALLDKVAEGGPERLYQVIVG